MTSNILDLSGQMQKYNVAVIDVSLYDYITIQRIGGSGEIYLTSTNDSGQITGITNGGVSTPIKCIINSGSDQIQMENTSSISVGNIVYGLGLDEQTEVISVDDINTITVSTNALATSTDAQLSFVYALGFQSVVAENVSTGAFTDILLSNNMYRLNSPFGKYLKFLGDLGVSTDKLLVFCSKIY